MCCSTHLIRQFVEFAQLSLTLPQPSAALLSISRSHLLPSLGRLLPICRREHEGLGGRSGGQGSSPEVNVRCRPTAGPAPHTAAFFQQGSTNSAAQDRRTDWHNAHNDTSHYLTHDPSFVHTHPQLCTFPTTLLWESLPDGPLSAALLSKWDIDCRETGMVSIPSYRFRPHPSRPRRASPSVDSTSTCLYCANNYAAAAGTDSSIRPTRKCDQFFLSPGCSQKAGWRTFYAPAELRNLRFSNPSGHSVRCLKLPQNLINFVNIL